jgi:multidrug efflux system membrane fusion protein
MDGTAEADKTASLTPVRRRRVRAVFLLLLLVAAGAVATYALGVVRFGWGQGPAAAQRPAPAVPVVIGAAATRDMPIWLTGIGTVQPLNVVVIRVRVDGELQRVAFTEGQEVHAGALLAQVDPRPFQAQLRLAEANLQRDQAQLVNARQDYARQTNLAGIGAAPTRNVDQMRAQVASLEASVQADQATIDSARLQLSFTTITAPIDGRVGLRQVDPGSIVHTGDANGLVTVTQIQPIAVLFALPQDELPDILAQSARGRLAVAIHTRDGSRHLADCTLIFVDSQVDQANGQIRLKAECPNVDRSLWPGLFVTARLLLRTDSGVTVVPSQAVQRGQNGTYVYVVNADSTVAPRDVTTGPAVDGVTAVRAGIAPGERIVLDGQSRLARGTRVAARPEPGAANAPAPPPALTSAPTSPPATPAPAR